MHGDAGSCMEILSARSKPYAIIRAARHPWPCNPGHYACHNAREHDTRNDNRKLDHEGWNHLNAVEHSCTEYRACVRAPEQHLVKAEQEAAHPRSTWNYIHGMQLPTKDFAQGSGPADAAPGLFYWR